MTPAPAVETPLHGPRSRDPWFYGWRCIRREAPDGNIFTERVPLTAWDVLHPQEEDFIVTNEAHDRILNYLKAVFNWRLADKPGALVLSDHRIDWQTAGLIPHGPDVTVLFDSAPWNVHRGTFPVRDMGAQPSLVVEVTSPSTRDTDLDEKVREYALAGIPQYVIVDSREEDTGWQVVFMAYKPSPEGPVRQILPEPNRVWLPAVNLWLAAEGDMVVCLKPDGSPVGDLTETMKELEASERRAEQERQRAEKERQRAEQERQRADALAAKMQELEAELRRLRGENP